jgi:hypothetical protein
MSAFFVNIRLGRKCLTVMSAQAYNNTVFITTVKSFIVQAHKLWDTVLDVNIVKLFFVYQKARVLVPNDTQQSSPGMRTTEHCGSTTKCIHRYLDMNFKLHP